jgi:hypothetical protein
MRHQTLDGANACGFYGKEDFFSFFRGNHELVEGVVYAPEAIPRVMA